MTQLMLDSNHVDDANEAFILRQLKVFNWGPFAGLHRAELDPQGTAIIGDTGSGKTTLVDALMTLIVQHPRYNLASTGGHESDRDLLSYVRGVTGTGNDSGDTRHIARPDKTITGLHACFGTSARQVHLAAIFWIDGTSSALADLKRLWFFGNGGEWPLEHWLEQHRAGGARAVKELVKGTPWLSVSENKTPYLAQVRRCFEVGENAFTLLNRAAGLKQLNSVDEIFRELVLDDHSAFTRAAEVASEFDDLAAIHTELETARKQQQSLLPLQQIHVESMRCEAQVEEHLELLRILPIWFAQQVHALWGEHVATLQTGIKALLRRLEELASQIESRLRMSTALKDIYLQAGGASVEQLKEQISTQQTLTSNLKRDADDYQRLTRSLKLDDTLSAEALLSNQTQVENLRLQAEAILREVRDKRLDVGSLLTGQRQKCTELKTELESLGNRQSNIPGDHHKFRAVLAQALGLPGEQLPFVAELVEVKSAEQRWRGAIERAIGSHRLRILVPPEVERQALDWINHRDNRLHVRLARASPPDKAPIFFEDGFTRKLNFKAHPHREFLKQLLSEMDRHCVDSPQTLARTAHGMTVQGLMTTKDGRYDKQDQKPLDKDWMTGFDNKDRLDSVTKELQESTEASEVYQQQYEIAEKQVGTVEVQIQLLDRLAELSFDKINLPGAQARLQEFEARLALLTDPDSEVEKARRDYERVETELQAMQKEQRNMEIERSTLEEQRRQAEVQRTKAFQRIGKGLVDSQIELAEAKLELPAQVKVDELDTLEREQQAGLQQDLQRSQGALQILQQKLIKQMGKAQSVDTGVLAETGQELQDVFAYLERLRVLTEEALPEKLQRFLSYLNQSSDQGVSQLLKNIDNEVTMIEERIADLNTTLRRVDFQPGHYLQLEPKSVIHESLRTLQAAQRHLRSAALSDDNGESHYKALQNLVALLRDASDTKKRTLGARALLDPRYRLQFAVLVLERPSGEIIERRTGSQGGSGGEKEIIASYILTASLSYALCPAGALRPLFATIVLDEAFSKSSQAVAGRIVAALREFGLHPLFVTPNKEMRLLRAHTRSAILVHRKGSRSTLTALSWEELDSLAQQRFQKHHEIT